MSNTTHKIMVFGGGGYIGSHTVLVLLEAGYTVVVADNCCNAVAGADGVPVALRRVEQLTGKSVEFHNIDVLDLGKVERLLKTHQFYCVMHFAALKAVGESIDRPLDYYYNNVSGSIRLIQACKAAGVKNFIFSSSATVYGTPERLPIDELCRVGQGITNPYGWSKFMVEQVLIDICKAEKDWNVTLLRYFNPVGAHESGAIGEDPRGTPNNLMPFVSQVAVGKRPHVNVFGNDYDTPDGTGLRDYIHIMDLARGHLAALAQQENEPQGCKIYNLGTGRAYSVLEMIAAMEKVCGHKIEYKITDRRSGDIASVHCNPELAAKELKWQAQLGLDEMCRDLWKWQSLNPNGFEQSEM